MISALSALFTKFGWSRDDLRWLWTQLVVGAGFVLTGVFDVHMWALDYLGVNLSTREVRWFMLVCGIVVWVAGKMSTSPLFGKGSVPTSAGTVSKLAVFLPLLLLAGLGLSACSWTQRTFGPPSTITTDAGKAAYSSDQVVKRLGEFQQAVIDLEGVNKIRTADARAVVIWISGDARAAPPVKGVVDILSAAPRGSHAVLLQSWAVLRPKVQAIPELAPYVAYVDGWLNGGL